MHTLQPVVYMIYLIQNTSSSSSTTIIYFEVMQKQITSPTLAELQHIESTIIVLGYVKLGLVFQL